MHGIDRVSRFTTHRGQGFRVTLPMLKGTITDEKLAQRLMTSGQGNGFSSYPPMPKGTTTDEIGSAAHDLWSRQRISKLISHALRYNYR